MGFLRGNRAEAPMVDGDNLVVPELIVQAKAWQRDEEFSMMDCDNYGNE